MESSEQRKENEEAERLARRNVWSYLGNKINHQVLARRVRMLWQGSCCCV